MGLIRTFLRDHRELAIWLVALALALKVLVPAGTMISSQGSSIVIRICDGQEHAQVRQIMVGQGTGGKADHGPADHGKGDGICPYSALGHASLGGTDPALLATALAFILTLAFAPLAPTRLLRIAHASPPLRGPPVMPQIA